MSGIYTFVGNVGRDPESQFTPSGSMVTKFSVAANTGYGAKKTTTWFNCEFWGEKLGDLVKEFVEKGSKVFISGELKIREWDDKEGLRHTANDVKVFQWEVLSGRKAKEDQEETPYDEQSDQDESSQD